MKIPFISLGLYIHIPWCVSRCPYCDFNAHQRPNRLPEKEYLDALKKQLQAISLLQLKIKDERKKLISVFIGGGTPSLVSSELIYKILEAVSTTFDISGSEITLEANPESLNREKLKHYQASGVNRISIGIQSFNVSQLKKLKRAHNEKQAKKAIELSLNYFNNINVDLMYGLIEQTEKQAIEDIKVLLDYPIHHISYYELTLEPNTHFYHFPPKLVSDKKRIKMQKNAIEIFADKGFKRYEISAYAQKNKTSKHNYNYWNFGDYWAIGAGGAAKITFFNGDHLQQYFRYQAPKNPSQFIKWSNQLATSNNKIKLEIINNEDKAFEFFLNATRLLEGVTSDCFTQQTGIPIKAIKVHLKQLMADNLIEPIKNFNDSFLIKPSKKGFNFLNEIPQQFLK